VRVVHLNTFDLQGGAARESHHLHQALLEKGIDSKRLVQKGLSDDSTVEWAFTSTRGKFLSKIAGYLDLLPLLSWPRRQKRVVWHPGWLQLFPVEKLSQVQQADIIALYWICGGFLGVKTIGHLLQLGKPAVWRLSDMWPFTGGCHYVGSCKGFEQQCGQCPQLGSKCSCDLSYRVLKQKKRSWDTSALTIVSPSNWLATCVRRSSLFGNARIEVIPNGVDTATYRQIPKAQARTLLNLPQDKQLLLFGAVNPLSDPRKGYKYLESALEILKEKNEIPLPGLVIFGSWQKPMQGHWPSQIYSMGYLHDEISKALLYAACDVFVAPSVEDNFPNTILEAMSCGTPCVAFSIGGIPDMIKHEYTGYLVKPFESSDLAHGINWVLSNSNRMKRLSQTTRQKVEEEFSSVLEAERYIKLYEELLKKRR